ncbi:MAG: hypothetical protein ACTSVD_07170 [Candidatus Thorarchaeota archaeon]
MIVLAGSWYLLPIGYETLILWLAPQLGNYVRPAMVMINALLVNPLNNLTMLAVWAGAGLVGGMIAGTKKGAFVVGFVTWFSCVAIFGFSIWQMYQTGIDLGTLPPLPQGSSILDVLTIPLVQSAIQDLIPLAMGGADGSSIDPIDIITPFLVYLAVPIITVIVTGIVGATIRPKEEF